MIDINFIPIFNDKEFVSATEEYRNIWASDGAKIVKTLESITDLKFKEDRIAVLVYEGVSFSVGTGTVKVFPCVGTGTVTVFP
jgi:hypothetical protein